MMKAFFWLISCLSSRIRNRIVRCLLKHDRSYVHLSAVSALLDEMNVKKVDYLDVGARRGVDNKHWQYREHLNFVLFEPDIQECEFLKNYYKDVRNIAVNSKTETISLNITDDPGGSYTSSNIKADITYNDQLLRGSKVVGSRTSVKNKINVQSKRLDECNLKGDVVILKIDVQGEELSVLKGLGKIRPACLKIEGSSLFEYPEKSQVEEIFNWARKNNYLMVGTNFPDKSSEGISAEFNLSLHGDYYFIDQNFRKNVRTQLLVATGLIIFDSINLAMAVLGQHPISNKITYHLSKSSKASLAFAVFKYNNAHDKRRFNK